MNIFFDIPILCANTHFYVLEQDFFKQYHRLDQFKDENKSEYS